MKKLFLLLFTISCFAADAKTYYISAASGSDANAGTSITTAWKTIAKLNSFTGLVAGDKVLFNRGESFYGSIVVNKSGSTGNPIVYGAYGTGANPVITGFTTVSAWTSLGNNIWESTAAVSKLNDVNCVVINDVNTAMGRFPNAGYFTTNSHVGTTSITSSSLTGSTNWTGADVVMRTWNFSIARNSITGSSGSTLSYKNTTVDNGHDGYGFFIENDVRTLDVQNEWYYNPSTKKIRIYSTSTPSKVQVSTLDTLAYMTSKSNLTFDGIDFTGSNRRAFLVGSCANVTIQNCNFNYHGLYAVWGGTNFGSPSTNFNFNHNTLNHINSQGIVLQSEYANPYIGYNTFKNCGVLPGMFKVPSFAGSAQWYGAYGSIFCAKTNGLVVEFNSIDSTGYTGVHFTGNNTRINNNEISNHCLQLMDGGGIYTWTGPSGTPSTGSKIYNNIVHDGYGNNEGTTEPNRLCQGLYLDENTRNTEVYNNTFFNNSYGGIFSNANQNCIIRNNTCYNNVLDQILCSNNYASSAEREQNNILSNNIFVSKTATQYVAKFTSKTNDISTFFKACDSNYFARPIDPTKILFTNINNASWGYYDVAQWKAIYPSYDAHSKGAPKTITNVNDLRIEYNATTQSKTISLDGNYIDVKNKSYNGTITLAPYTSAVLIRNGAAKNQPPVAAAGDDQLITLPVNSVSLSGSGTDVNGTIASYGWTKISGPATGTITSATSAATTITAMTEGVYLFQLNVTDTAGAIGLDTVQITVNTAGNVLPSVNAGSDQVITLPNSTANLSGTATDPDGTITAYSWTKISGPASGVIGNASSSATTITGLTEGVYQFQLVVTDNKGVTALDNVQISVTAADALLPAVNPANTVNGLDYSYYESATGYSKVPAFSTLTPVRNGTATDFTISSADRTTMHSFNFTGFIMVPTDGKYTFYTTSDDGSNLYIDNIKVVNNDGVHGATEHSGTIGLKAGKHAISVGYFQQDGGGVLAVSYNGPGIAKKVFPASALYRISATGNRVALDNNQKSISPVQLGVKAYPNPFDTYIDISVNGGIAGEYKMMLMDAAGKIVWTKSGIKDAGSFKQIVNTSAFLRGIYFLKVVQNDTSSVIKLVK